MSGLEINSRILLIGIGNSGRSDDALGWKFVEAFSSREDVFDIEYRYQLQIEDALLISSYERVIFVDASRKVYENGFSFYRCESTKSQAFTTHALEPEAVLWLANDLFNSTPEVYIMAISGLQWELNIGISSDANKHFENASSYFTNWLATETRTMVV